EREPHPPGPCRRGAAPRPQSGAGRRDGPAPDRLPARARRGPQHPHGRHGRRVLPGLDLARPGAPRRALDRPVRPGHRRPRAPRRGGRHRHRRAFRGVRLRRLARARAARGPGGHPAGLGDVRLPVPAGGAAAGALVPGRDRHRWAGARLLGPVPRPADGRGGPLALLRRRRQPAGRSGHPRLELPGLAARRPAHDGPAAAARARQPAGPAPGRPGARGAVPVDVGVVGPGRRRLLRAPARGPHRRAGDGAGRGAVRPRAATRVAGARV
ncbi:MAG: Carotenoid biosynthesis protein, partial [uncultured Frankineae bacterium]